MNVQAYKEYQQRLHARYSELLKGYVERPFKVRHTLTDVEGELDIIEKKMIENPPLVPNGNGGFVRAGMGLTTDNRLIESGKLPQVRVVPFEATGLRVIPLRDWDDYIQSPDRTSLKVWMPDTLSQGSVGSCAADGLAGAGMCLRNSKGQVRKRLNGYGMYWSTSGGRDGGSSLQANISYMQTHGCPTEDVRPRSKGWRASPTEEEREDAKKHRLLEVAKLQNWEQYGTCCLYGLPVYSGYSGHAWFGLEPVSTSRLKWQNSWGDNWGDNGTGTLSASRIYWGYGVYVILAMVDEE